MEDDEGSGVFGEFFPVGEGLALCDVDSLIALVMVDAEGSPVGEPLGSCMRPDLN